MRKKLSTFFAVLFAVLSALVLPASAQTTNANISLDANPLNLQAVIDKETVFLPIRSLCEALGYKVSWALTDGNSTVTVQKDDSSIVLDLTNQKINDNGHSYYAQVDSGTGISVISNCSYLDSKLFDSLFSIKTQYVTATNQITLKHVSKNSIKITTETLTANEKFLDTAIQYPQITGLPDIKVQASINDVLKQSALASQSEGQTNAKDMEGYINGGDMYSDAKCVTNFNYSVQYNQNGLLSIVLEDYQYLGGAHGSTFQSSFTFDLATGKALSLGDLMNSSSNYTSYFNAGIRKEIDKRVASGELIEFDTDKFASISDTPAYYLSGNGIVFYFQQYEYFPYAAGIQAFSFDYSSLQSMLKTEYKSLN